MSSRREVFFSRQLRVPFWDDVAIANTTALVLGAGGIGSSIAMALCRMGIKKMFLLDCDVVDESNLNRQALFSKEQIGLPKVEAATATLNATHNVGCTELVPMQCDAVKCWHRVVAAAKESNVIFNAIDFGSQFDVAVGSLAAALRISYVAGSTYAHCAVVDSYPLQDAASPCPQCAGMVSTKDACLPLLHHSQITQYEDLSNVIHGDTEGVMPTGAIGSHAAVCIGGSMVIVNAWLQSSVMKREVGLPKPPTWAMYDLVSVEVARSSVEKDPNCPICGPKRQ